MAFINKKIEELINYRIVEEEKSARLYLAMSQWLDYNGFAGAAKLWKKYSDEEIEHAAMALEWLRIKIPEFDFELKENLFKEGPISGDHGESEETEETVTLKVK